MKREAVNHTKMRRLARELSIEIWAARGLMESIWYVCSEETPAGDIGKLSDQDLADAIGWLNDPCALVSALVRTGWLDESTQYRLLVHDWKDHCPDYIHMRLARQKIRFADGTFPSFTKLTQKDRKSLKRDDFSMPSPRTVREYRAQEPPLSAQGAPTQPIPTHTNPTDPDPQNGRAANETLEVIPFFPADRFFDLWWKLWSDTKGTHHMQQASTAYGIHVTNGHLHEQLMECTATYLASLDSPNKGFNPENFIMDQSRQGFTARFPPPRAPNRGREAAIGRGLASRLIKQVEVP